MLFWAGLRGAVGVALAAGLTGKNGSVLRATVLVVVVLTVIIFGGTTSRMLEILGIRTGVVEEIDSDDEFDIEIVTGNGTGNIYQARSGQGIGHIPRPSGNQTTIGLSNVDVNGKHKKRNSGSGFTSGSRHGSPADNRPNGFGVRRNSKYNASAQDFAEQGLLSPADSGSLSSAIDSNDDDLDLPPQARRSKILRQQQQQQQQQPSAADGSSSSPYPTSGTRDHQMGPGAESPAAPVGRLGAISGILGGLAEDPSEAFRKIDEGFIKPHLLLDPKAGGSSSH